jgi:hypothetical protein
MLPNVVLGVFGEVLVIVIYNCIAASSVFPRRAVIGEHQPLLTT